MVPIYFVLMFLTEDMVICSPLFTKSAEQLAIPKNIVRRMNHCKLDAKRLEKIAAMINKNTLKLLEEKMLRDT